MIDLTPLYDSFGRIDAAVAKADTPCDAHLDGMLDDDEDQDEVGDEDEDDGEDEDEKNDRLEKRVGRWGVVPVVKRKAQKNYTLAPVYVPNTEDAHGDWADPDDLQDALHDMVRTGDRGVNLQHIDKALIGEWVELVVWPYAHEATLTVPGQPVRKVWLPPRTPYMGVIWTPPAFEAIDKGLIRSLSIEGRAKRTVADIPTLTI